MKQAKTVAGYIRVSSKKQDHVVQKNAIQQWADNKGITVKFYSDKFTGKVMDRPGWTKLQQDMDAGKVKHLIVHRLDRLGRTASGLTTLFDYLIDNKIGFVSLKESLDLSTPAGKLMATVVAGVAQYDNEVRTERINEGIAAAHKAGKRWGGCKAGRSKLTPEQIKNAHTLHKAGTTKAALARLFGVSYPTMHKIIGQVTSNTPRLKRGRDIRWIMLEEPKCWKRKCKHYIGVKNDGNESTERFFCEAFPDRIPREIAYGKNKHLKPVDGDHGIQYEKE